MKTDQGVKLIITPVTAYTVSNILSEWVAERTPVADYIERQYADRSEDFKDFARKSVSERVARMEAVIQQLEN